MLVMIVSALPTIAPVFGPLGYTVHYIGDFLAERPQPIHSPDTSFFIELLALIVTLMGLLMFAISLFFFMRSRERNV
jgi:hypothetical protein